MCRDNFLISLAIWFANSLVGAKTNVWILYFFTSSFLTIGIEKATVLPEPVFALAITSLFSKVCGKTFSCIGVNFSKPNDSKFCWNSFEIFNEEIIKNPFFREL